MRDERLVAARTIVALVTPFIRGDNGSLGIDWTGYRRLLEGQVRAGIGAILLAGTTGECATLSECEWGAVIGFGMAVIAGRVPVIVGTGTNNTSVTIERTQFAASLGVQTVLVVSPYYNRPPPEGLYRHFSQVANSVPSIDIILYNVPSRTGSDITPDIANRLAKISNIVGIKEASGDLTRVPLLRKGNCAPPFKIYSGNDDTANANIDGHTYDGVISVTANVFPKVFGGELAKCTPENVVNLHNALFLRPNPIPVKFLLSQLGVISPHVRLPLVEMDGPEDAQLRVKILEAYTQLGQACPFAGDVTFT